MIRAANRHMLPLEMLMGWVTMTWGVSGGLGTGHLHALLVEAASSIVWLVMLVAMGAAQTTAALVEWRYGGAWAMNRRWRAARIRLALNFFVILSWVWIMKFMWDYPYPGLVFLGPAVLLFEGWSALENYKVRLAADEKIDTSHTLSLR